MINSKIMVGGYLTGLIYLSSCSLVEAQVSYFTDPDSDAVVFETWKATTIVVPKSPATKVDIPSTYGTSSYYVSPGGYVSPTYEVDKDD